jgi:two-component system, chemotaxis family, CheB/CheR fusion protein
MAKKVPRQAKHAAMTARTAPRKKEHPDTGTKESPQQSTAGKHPLFPIVGVGASAGGLEAFTAFLKHLPDDSGMAFVLIQHLDPKQHSQLTDLLAKATRMPVLEVDADTPIEPDHVYVMAPGVCLSMSDGHIRVEERGGGRNLPIDYFLRSLAGDNTSKAIGIVLSGTASDGTLGLKAVKAEGDITFAQEPSSAKFDGMPRSAIAAGVVDFVLAPDEIARRLVRLAQHPFVEVKSGEDSEAAKETESALNRILHLLRAVTGNDFTHYKHSTIRRRIHRRMVLHASEKPDDYIAYLRENPAEARALADDLLICVTSFFREPDALEALAASVFPAILKGKSPENSIRIWVPGCATGEEAYTVAICLTEFLERSGANVPIQIFASDISERAVEKARAGIYATPTLADVSPARLKRFFVKVSGGYQIAKSIRESCIFARQNIAKDPPFHNLDLITCCNVLIYFGPVLQRKALATFHYALKPGGFLMLGPSESVGPLSHAFLPLDKKLKLYSKQPGSGPLNLHLLASESLEARDTGAAAGGNVRVALEVQKTAEQEKGITFDLSRMATKR